MDDNKHWFKPLDCKKHCNDALPQLLQLINERHKQMLKDNEKSNDPIINQKRTEFVETQKKLLNNKKFIARVIAKLDSYEKDELRKLERIDNPLAIINRKIQLQSTRLLRLDEYLRIATHEHIEQKKINEQLPEIRHLKEIQRQKQLFTAYLKSIEKKLNDLEKQPQRKIKTTEETKLPKLFSKNKNKHFVNRNLQASVNKYDKIYNKLYNFNKEGEKYGNKTRRKNTTMESMA